MKTLKVVYSGPRVLWRNVPARMWLWRHQGHAHSNLTGTTWTCSCGSTQAAPRRNPTTA